MLRNLPFPPDFKKIILAILARMGDLSFLADDTLYHIMIWLILFNPSDHRVGRAASLRTWYVSMMERYLKRTRLPGEDRSLASRALHAVRLIRKLSEEFERCQLMLKKLPPPPQV